MYKSFWVGNFDFDEVFFGCEISGSCNFFFCGVVEACNMKFDLTPVMYTASIPPRDLSLLLIIPVLRIPVEFLGLLHF